MTPRTILDVRELGFAYGAHVALTDVSFALTEGEIVCLLGPNGAGKSTLVKLLTGSLRPTQGEMIVDGHGVPDGSVGLVPQDIALFPWLTAEENCRAFARFAGLDRRLAQARVAAALELTGCMEVAGTQVRRLSGGYKRRINIAAALVGEPRLLILDEPTVGVDLEARSQIAAIIRRLRVQGTTILLVTHDFAEADALADRVAFLDHGRLVAFDTPKVLVDWLFERQKRIEIVMRDVPEAQAEAILYQLGAQPTSNPAIWNSFRAIDGWDADPFAAALAARGIDFTEIRLRDPGIEALYAGICLTGQAA